ncbi:hypothetical protein Smic_62890 [Streptomyces microflavus]|uniref:Uncharacterized protein n=1 Tax=Streptomyces microflavus TaxID=1919 RepID=A0A7J0CZ37_STRMI|nr:hypothetical protein Smic_62890 [Streptomyces microflavus]
MTGDACPGDACPGDGDGDGDCGFGGASAGGPDASADSGDPGFCSDMGPLPHRAPARGLGRHTVPASHSARARGDRPVKIKQRRRGRKSIPEPVFANTQSEAVAGP